MTPKDDLLITKITADNKFTELLQGNDDLDDQEPYRRMSDCMFDVE
ncbi:hypothetical protein TrispH2_005664 [Trichoplax sp. H2]|nr:hypothetical protein TrispH2_005664 [Trichoplax sp. H2]|eukprot:RDD41576.1 hypothetical protein TrispH2_005664 [Trichoplax sp. H2]